MKIINTFFTTYLLSVLFLFPIASTAQSDADSEFQWLQRAEQDASQELLQIDKHILQDREDLRRAEITLLTKNITPALLEDARLELALLDSRESGLKTRLKARHLNLEQLSEEILSIETRVLRQTADEPTLTQWKQELESMRQNYTILDDLINKLARLHSRYEIRSSLARQRLNLLQSRFQLPELEDAKISSNQATQKLQKKINNLLSEASLARRNAAQLDQKNLKEKAQRRLLELEALVAEERAEFHQLEIIRLQMKRVLQSLSSFSNSRSTPVRVLKTAIRNIDKMLEETNQQQQLIEQKQAQFNDQRLIVIQQGNIAIGTDSTLQARLTLIDDLLKFATKQLTEISELNLSMQKAQEKFTLAISENARTELLIQRELPQDSQSWNLLARNLMGIPLRVIRAFKEAIINTADSFVNSSPKIKLLCILVLILFIVSAWQALGFISRKIQIEYNNNDSAASVHTPLAIIKRNFLSLIPPLVVLITGIILNINQNDLLLLMTPLLILPVVLFALDFINNLLDEYLPELEQSKTRILLIETRWVVILTAIFAAVFVTAHTVALSPTVIDAIDRLSMLCLLLIALPMIHLRMLLLKGVKGDVKSRLVRSFTLLIPILLVLCALIGVIGYINLSLAIVIRLGWFILIVLSIHLIRNMLRILFKKASDWFHQRDAESAPFWEQYILGPVYRLTLLLVVLIAAQLLFYLFEWNAQTPVVRTIPLLLDTTLFSLGETVIKFKTLLLAIVALVVAIWGAGWTRQVSYRWLYTSVQDNGIRNSLSTFSQYLVIIVGVIFVMKIIGLDLTTLTVFAGAFGVAVGFGMQQIVVNFISGLLLLAERPLATTDLVNVDKYEGEVTRIGIRSLTVKTFDNQEVIIPNSSVITKPFTNWTRSDDIMRTVLMVGIGYDADPHQAVDIIKAQLQAHTAVLQDPGHKVLLWDYGDSALMLRIQFHTRIRGAIGRADVRSQILFEIWDKFKEAGISIPYPQRDVHVYQE